MPKIMSKLKTAVQRGLSDDRGDDRPGVWIKIGGHQAWLTRVEALQLEHQLAAERTSR